MTPKEGESGIDRGLDRDVRVTFAQLIQTLESLVRPDSEFSLGISSLPLVCCLGFRAIWGCEILLVTLVQKVVFPLIQILRLPHALPHWTMLTIASFLFLD